MILRNKKILTIMLSGALLLPLARPYSIFADAVTTVTIGESLNPKQRNQILNFFGVKENEVDIRIITNKEERKYLEGIVPDEQIGYKTYSCAYVQPTKKGSGINVKLSNFTYVTPQMLQAAIISLGLGENTDMEIIGASVIPVSGTGCLTGVISILENSGIDIDEDKKAIASEELLIVSELGEEIGKDKATGIINDIKIDILKNNTQDTIQIADTINNITNTYNINLSTQQQKDIQELMEKISRAGYEYNDIKGYLKDLRKSINTILESTGEKIDNTTLLEKVGMWFDGFSKWFKNLFTKTETSIIENTNDSALGANAIINSTEELKSNDSEITKVTEINEENFFTKIWNWIKSLFNKDNANQAVDIETEENYIDESLEENDVEETIEELEATEENNNSEKENNISSEIDNEESTTDEDSTIDNEVEQPQEEIDPDLNNIEEIN